MARHGMSDEEWAVIDGCFPRPNRMGRPPMDARKAFEAICWILRSGAPWRDLPEEFGPWETVYGHFNTWSSDGTLKSALELLKRRFSREGRFDHTAWSIDGTIVRAHRCTTGGGKKGIPTNRKIMHLAAPAAVFRPKSISSAMEKVGR